MANRYLLLRRNKQTGPYSIDELQKMPLEQYDLVWIDGISDSWKHPGEIDELKSFAPFMGNLQYNFNARKPGAMVQLPTEKIESFDQPVSEPSERQEARFPNKDNNAPRRSMPVAKGIASGNVTNKRKSVKHNNLSRRKTAQWAIPVVAILLIGIWIGANWNYFPANEGVSVPITNNTPTEKNGAATYEERNNTLQNTPKNEKANANAQLIPSEPAKIDKPVIEHTEKSEENSLVDADNNSAIQPSQNAAETIDEPVVKEKRPNNKIVSEDVSQKASVPVVPKTKPIEQKIVKPSASVVKSSEQKTGRPTEEKNAKPSQERMVRTSAEKIVTPSNNPSTAKVIKAGTSRNAGTSRANDGVADSKQSGISDRTNAVFTSGKTNIRKEIVYESYLSKKQVPVGYLVEVDGNYQKNADGKGVNEVDFTVYNRSGKFINAVSLEVQYLGKNNELLKKEIRKFYNISSDGAIKMEVDSHKNADRVGYKVLYVSSSIGDFYYEPVELFSSASR